MAGHITVREVTDKQAWEDFLAGRPEANFLQSWYWGEFHNRLNHDVGRLGFYNGPKLIGVALTIVEPARRGRHLTLPAGPIIDWDNTELVETWLETIKQQARAKKCLFVRVRPQLPNTPESQTLFKRLGLRPAPMHLHAQLTTKLDLGKTDEELKKAMRKGTRYDLNRSGRMGIKVEAVTDDRYLDEFYKLQIQTAERQKFVPFSRRFLAEQFQTFAEAGNVVMYRSSHEGKLLAMAFVIFYGREAVYHYGASTDLARKIPGAYAVQWEAIQEARRRGCLKYDFWGVTEHKQTKHRFYGVSVFKRGFGGEDVAYLPAHDLVIDPLKYPLTYVFETARRKIRHL